MSTPTDAKARKAMPMMTGLLDYFPDALMAVAAVSKAGNDQHNPGEPLHWSREKSNDHLDCGIRHALDHGKMDADNQRHMAKACWRFLAELQLEIERAEALVAAHPEPDAGYRYSSSCMCPACRAVKAVK